MRDGPRHRPVAERLLSFLIGLFPRDFRDSVGPALLRAHLDQLDDLAEQGSIPATVAHWVVTVTTLVRDAVLERGSGLRRTLRPRRGVAPTGNPRLHGVARVLAADGVARDALVALRSLRREPSFGVVVVTTLALGVAATTSVFSILDGILLRPLPYAHPEELHQVGVAFGESTFDAISVPNFRELREAVGDRIGIVAAGHDDRVLIRDGVPREMVVQPVSHDFFHLLGCAPSLGRDFGASDEAQGAPPVAILSHGLWERAWGRDPSVIGRTIHLDESPFTVVGVAARGFRPPEALVADVDLWVPLPFSADDVESRGEYAFQMLARIPAGLDEAAALRDLNAVATALAEAHPEDNSFNGHPLQLWMRDLRTSTVGDVGQSLGVLMGAVGLLLLVSCANVAGLFLARSRRRERDTAVRAALGASRAHLVRETLAGGLATALLAGVLGGLLTFGGVRLFKALNPGDLPRIDEVGVDWRVFTFALAVSTVSGALVSLAPAIRTAATNGAGSLQAGSRWSSGGRGVGALRSTLIVVETALALMLLTGSGLLLNSLLRLHRVDAGFDHAGLVVADLEVTRHRDDPAGLRTFEREVMDRVRRLPAAAGATLVTHAPLQPDGGSWTRVAMEGHTYDEESPRPFVRITSVGDDFAEVLGARVMEGRRLEPPDRDPAGGIMVNQALVAEFWPEESAIGRTIQVPSGDGERVWAPVVGVLADVRQRALGRASEPEIYIPFSRVPRAGVTILVRVRGDPGALVPALRAAVWSVDPAQPVDRVVTMDQQRAMTVAEPRFHAVLMTGFGALALVLASVGLYGTLSYAVSTRTRELGIRLALGADRRKLVVDVMVRGLGLVTVGVGLGLAGSLAAGRVLQAVLFGVTPRDPATLAVVPAILLCVAALACWVPARRAAATDPTTSLRSE